MPLPLPIEFFDPASEPLDPGNVVHITDHEASGLALLIPEYQDTPRWQAWVASMLISVQEIETAEFDVWEIVLNIDEAVGAQLDLIGRIVREDRDGRTNDLYRRAISVRILINKSQGRIEELVLIVRTFEGPSFAGLVRVRENTTVQGAHLEVRAQSVPVNVQGEILKRLRQAKAGGVGLQLLVTPTPNTTPATRTLTLIRASAYPEKNTTTGLHHQTGAGSDGGYLMHAVS